MKRFAAGLRRHAQPGVANPLRRRPHGRCGHIHRQVPNHPSRDRPAGLRDYQADGIRRHEDGPHPVQCRLPKDHARRPRPKRIHAARCADAMRPCANALHSCANAQPSHTHLEVCHYCPRSNNRHGIQPFRAASTVVLEDPRDDRDVAVKRGPKRRLMPGSGKPPRNAVIVTGDASRRRRPCGTFVMPNRTSPDTKDRPSIHGTSSGWWPTSVGRVEACGQGT